MLFSQYSPSLPTHSGLESTSPSRTSRLRRFSTLRSYSHRSSSTTTTTTTPAVRDTNPTHLTFFSSSEEHPDRLSLEATRARLAAAIDAATARSDSERTRNRLTLVQSSPNPPRPTILDSDTSPETRSSNFSTFTFSSNFSRLGRLSRSSAEPSPPKDQTSLLTAEQPANMTRARSLTTGDAVSPISSNSGSDAMPSIRLSAYYDPRSTRPSLTFSPISRTLPTGTEAIRVGRYSERDCATMANLPGNQPSSAPVGFKSKVVSRRHCEFWHENGKWYIKDVKSSSGTFLNHIRLSPPSQESKAFPINDGDIIQLGIDFKGGEEMIFRCVKMRVELNRGWQNKLNTFNMAAHKRLRTMGTNSPAAGSQGSSDCSICLNSIAPCQSLFVAPCSHTWHFKCVRSLLQSPQYPIFICPNCRASADLEGDVEDPTEDWEQLDADMVQADTTSVNGAEGSSQDVRATVATEPISISAATDDEHGDESTDDAFDRTIKLTASETPIVGGNLTHTTSAPLPIRSAISGAGRSGTSRDNRTPSPPVSGAEGPITPRNEAGPWVFDGSAGSSAADEPAETMVSLDAAADMTPVFDRTSRRPSAQG